MADEKNKKPELGFLDEDDEFEEFPAEGWSGKAEDETDVNVWEDNWDDENIDDDFSNQLRAELEKQGQKLETTNNQGSHLATWRHPTPCVGVDYIQSFLRLRSSPVIRSKLFRIFNRPSIVSLSQTRLCSINNSDNDDQLSRFEKLLRDKRRQASKTVLIHIYSKFVVLKLYNYCQKYGKIAKAFHYNLDSDKDFILMEFENESSVYHLLSEARHFDNQNVIPVQSKCLWYQETHHGKDILIPAEVESTAVVPESEIIVSLQQASTVGEQMIKLHKHLKLSDMGQQLRFFVCHQLESAFSGLFSNCTILPFGSTVNGFGKFNCDLDMVLTLRNEIKAEDMVSEGPSRLFFHTKRSLSNGRAQSQRHLETLSDMISSFLPGCSNVQRILQARVPIIKFVHDLVNTECDLSMINLTGVYMSELLYLYAEFDKRLQPLVFTILKWARQNGLTHESPGKWITNFSLILMVIFFFQTRQRPILPSIGSLQKLAGSSDKRITDGIAKPDYSPLYIENPLEISLNVGKNVSGDEVERMSEKLKHALWTLELSRDKANHAWGLLTLFNVQMKPSSNTEKRLAMSTFFEKNGNDDNVNTYNNNSNGSQLIKSSVKSSNHSPNDLVSKLELRTILARAGGKSRNQDRTRTTLRKRNPKQKNQPRPWSF
ncbi:hypothetical protein CHUAL_000759 [Chamberlinius hualienensis]